MRRTSRRIRRNSRRRTSLRRNSPRFNFDKHFGAMSKEVDFIIGSITDDLEDFRATDNDMYLSTAEAAYRKLLSAYSKLSNLAEFVESKRQKLGHRLDAAARGLDGPR